MHKLSFKVADTLKSLRKRHSWSLDKTSNKTGVSKAMLGQIEREESSPTLSTLWKIASGFNVSFSSFINDPAKKSSIAALKKGKFKEMSPDKKISVMPLLTYEPDLSFELFVIELLPDFEQVSPPHNEGVIEHVVVIEGEMEVLLENKWHRLKQHEAIKFNADQKHGYRNRSAKKAVIHDIIHYT